MVYRWSFIILSFFIPGVISAQPLVIRSPNCFTDTRVMIQGCKRMSRISKILVTYLTGCQKPLKCIFYVFFTGWPHIFVHCANTVWARRNLKTDLSSTMNYLSWDITLVTVVWAVILQITAWNHWSNSEKLCSDLMAASWLLRIDIGFVSSWT